MQTVFRFGDYELDANLYELRRGGKTLPAKAKVLDLLLYLVRERRRVVTRGELLEVVWVGVAVTGGSVSRTVMEARRLLADSAQRPRLIASVRSRGYRFIGEVAEDAPQARRMRGAIRCASRPWRLQG